ncbi:uncharacterized protein [Ptychodera flava]|uniref:uncharacterized protein n=1 Tax=Ptychodera flava TaxID=63121 RepID=UPI00396A8BB9
MQRRDKVSALIINECWGSASRDGIPSINRMIASVLSDIEIHNIYSTVVRYNANDTEEAKVFNVKFKKAEPKERRFDNILRSGLVPNRDYLYLHDYFYPNLRELESDVKLMFSYSLATAEEARKLKQDIFNDAALYFINLWNPETINPAILSCDQTELSKRGEELPKQFIEGSHIVSVGKGTHEHFKPDHRRGQSSTHYYIQPNFIHGKTISNRYKQLDIETTFEIVSMLQPTDCTHSQEIIRQVLEDVALANKGKFRIVWKIIGDFPGKEDSIEDNFTPSGIDLRIKVCSSLKQIVDALLGCHLVLSHSKTHISDPSISLALSLGVPLLLPDNLDFEHLIDKYLVNYKNDLMVKIGDKYDLRKQLEVKIGSYGNAVSKAREISDQISQHDLAKESCSELRKDIEMLLDRILPISEATQGDGDDSPRSVDFEKTEDAAKPVAESTADEHTLEEESSTLSFRRSIVDAGPSRTTNTEDTEHVDEPGETISVSCDVAYGIPETEQEMAEIEKELFDRQEQSEAHEATRQAVENLENGTEVSEAEEGSIRYNIRCTTSEALRGVWRHYQSGTLCDTVQKTLITPDVLSKVHAISITMRVVIDHSEYKEALNRLTSREKTGAVQETSTKTKMQERENEGELPTEMADGKNEETQGLTSSKRKLSEAEVSVLEAMNEQLSQENKNLKDLFANKEKERDHLAAIEQQADQINRLQTKVAATIDFFSAFEITIGGLGNAPGQFNNPSGIAMDRNGDLIVADKSNCRVQIINLHGTCKDENVFDKYKGWFRPRDVALSSEGSYFTTDHGRKKVVIYDVNSKLLTSFNVAADPYGIAVCQSADVLICDDTNNCVKKYSKEGKCEASFGSYGRERGQFDLPRSVAVNSKDQILVSDQNNHRVQLLSSDGEYLNAFGSEGSDPGQLRRPHGIDVDQNDNVYVCDYGNDRIVQFSAKGEFLQNIGEGKVSPRYIAVSKDNFPLRVAVSDGDRHCIKVFFLKENVSEQE